RDDSRALPRRSCFPCRAPEAAWHEIAEDAHASERPADRLQEVLAAVPPAEARRGRFLRRGKVCAERNRQQRPEVFRATSAAGVSSGNREPKSDHPAYSA